MKDGGGRDGVEVVVEQRYRWSGWICGGKVGWNEMVGTYEYEFGGGGRVEVVGGVEGR